MRSDRTALTIHGFAALAAGVGAGLGPFPGADSPVLVSIQAAMVLALAEERGVPMGRVAAAEMVLTLGAAMAGRTAARGLAGLVPWAAPFARASTAAALTEAVGWAAVRWFEDGRC